MSRTIKILAFYPVSKKDVPDKSIIWVSEFVNLTEDLYSQLFDEKIEIAIKDFRPVEKEETFLGFKDEFDILFPVISPEYLKNKSYEELLKKMYDDGGYGEKLHLIVQKPIFDSKFDWLNNFSTYNIFERNVGIRSFKVIDFSKKVPDNSVIWDNLIDLVYDIHQFSSGEAKQVNTSIKVFVAETTPDQEIYRDKIIRELRQRGFDIFPKSTLPRESEELKKEIKENCQKSQLSIHIMGGIYGDYIKNTAYSLNDFQNRQVKEFIAGLKDKYSFQRIIWIPPYLKIPDQRQELYLRRIRREETDKATEIIQAPLEDLKKMIFQKIAAGVKLSGNKKTDKKSLYLIYDSTTETILDKLKSLLNYNDIKSLELNYDDQNVLESHYENLSSCDGVIILYNGLEGWLNSKLNDLKKVWGYGREKPFKVKALLLKEDSYNKIYKRDIGDVIKIIYQDELLDKSLSPIFNELNSNESGSD